MAKSGDTTTLSDFDLNGKSFSIDGGVVLESGPPEQVLGDPVEARTQQFLARVIDAGRL
jgi:ABC-type histidine transport system ATPase subunit